MAHIFISYATPDRAIAEEVSGWLRAAGHELFLDHDLRDGISPGEDWMSPYLGNGVRGHPSGDHL